MIPGTISQRTDSSHKSIDRRQTHRYQVSSGTGCDIALQVLDDIGTVRVRDVSTIGIGLLVDRAIEPGTVLVLALRNQAQSFSKTTIIEVCHSTPLDNGSYVLGGEFLIPLTYDEMRAMIM